MSYITVIKGEICSMGMPKKSLEELRETKRLNQKRYYENNKERCRAARREYYYRKKAEQQAAKDQELAGGADGTKKDV